MPHFAASDLVLRGFPMSHKKEARFIWVNIPTDNPINDIKWVLLADIMSLYIY